MIRTLLAVLATVALALTAWYARSLQGELAEVRSQATENQSRAVSRALVEERRIRFRLQEALDAQTDETRAARADAAAAGDAADRLRQRAKAIATVRDVPQADGLARVCQAERDAAERISDALGRVVGRARQLAAWLDDSRAAGLLCERYVDALTQPKDPPEDETPSTLGE